MELLVRALSSWTGVVVALVAVVFLSFLMGESLECTSALLYVVMVGGVPSRRKGFSCSWRGETRAHTNFLLCFAVNLFIKSGYDH